MIQQNLVTQTTSTVFKILTWNFKHTFSMKCRCAWHIFCVDQSILFCREHDLTKSCYANFYSFQHIDLKLKWYVLHEVRMLVTYFLWISPFLVGGEHYLTKSCYANFYTYYVNSFQDIEYKLKTCSWVHLRNFFFSCGSVHYFLEGSTI